MTQLVWGEKTLFLRHFYVMWSLIRLSPAAKESQESASRGRALAFLWDRSVIFRQHTIIKGKKKFKFKQGGFYIWNLHVTTQTSGPYNWEPLDVSKTQTRKTHFLRVWKTHNEKNMTTFFRASLPRIEEVPFTVRPYNVIYRQNLREEENIPRWQACGTLVMFLRI